MEKKMMPRFSFFGPIDQTIDLDSDARKNAKAAIEERKSLILFLFQEMNQIAKESQTSFSLELKTTLHTYSRGSSIKFISQTDPEGIFTQFSHLSEKEKWKAISDEVNSLTVKFLEKYHNKFDWNIIAKHWKQLPPSQEILDIFLPVLKERCSYSLEVKNKLEKWEKEFIKTMNNPKIPEDGKRKIEENYHKKVTNFLIRNPILTIS